MMSRMSLMSVALCALAALGCKKTESNTAAKAAEGSAAPTAAPAADKAAPAAPAADKAAPAADKAAAPAAAGATVTYTNPEPGFTINVPEGFVANEPTQTGGNNTSIRLAKPGEHSGIGTFVSITWWKPEANAYKRLLSQKAPDKANRLDEKDIAGGKGKFFYGTKTASRMVSGELKDAKEYVGAAVVEAPTAVLTCTVESFDDPPAPAFIRACETLAAK
jgi:hypothetical protein